MARGFQHFAKVRAFSRWPLMPEFGEAAEVLTCGGLSSCGTHGRKRCGVSQPHPTYELAYSLKL
jgi:hypothetical protein